MDASEPMFRNVSTALALLRELRGLAQTECARRAGMTKAQLSRYETARESPKLESLDRALRVLEVGPAEFFAVVSAVDRLAAGCESMESIQRSVLERQQSILDEFLGCAAKASLSATGGRRGSLWLKILSMYKAESSTGRGESI